MSRLPGRSTKKASREKVKAEEECRERHVRNEIVQEVVAGIEKMAKAQIDDKPIAQRTVEQSAKQSWDSYPFENEEEEEDDLQKEDQMEMQWVEDVTLEEILERRRAEGVPHAGRGLAEGARIGSR